MTRHIWTPIEEYILRKVYPHYRTVDIAVVMGLPTHQVYAKAARMHIGKSEEFLNGNQSGRTDGLRGQSTRFKKGHVTWNTGISYQAGGRARETQFKKGHRPKNEMPVGSYRINGDGYVEYKFADVPGRYDKRWIPVHRKVWIEANGAIPPKHMIVFKPGARTVKPEEITLDRLECIDRTENARRNNIWANTPEYAQLVNLKSQITRRVNKIIKESPCQTSAN